MLINEYHILSLPRPTSTNPERITKTYSNPNPSVSNSILQNELQRKQSELQLSQQKYSQQEHQLHQITDQLGEERQRNHKEREKLTKKYENQLREQREELELKSLSNTNQAESTLRKELEHFYNEKTENAVKEAVHQAEKTLTSPKIILTWKIMS